MTYDSKDPPRLELTGRSGLGRIQIETEAFFEFSFWLAEELVDLVAQWRDFAPPDQRHESAAGWHR